MRALRVVPLAAVALLLAAGAVRAAEVRLVASDPTGVTLRLAVGAWQLDPKGDAGRVVPTVDGLSRTTDAGRARLPYGAALIAVPPGTRPVVRVLTTGGEEIRDGVRIAIAGRPSFEKDEKLGQLPTVVEVEPIRDGAWPAQLAEMAEPYTVRERRFVSVQIYPFRYDEAAARLTLTREITVRVDFGSGARAAGAAELDDAEDPQFDAVFESQVLNWEQGKGWRMKRPAARSRGIAGGARSSSLLDPRTSGTLPFDESEPEVRVRIDTTGVYAIDFDSLAFYGYPAGVPIAEVSVHRHEFLEDESPPYTTVDLPIEVDDLDGNNVFGSGDRILIWVWDWAQRSDASVPGRLWGDAEVIYVTRKPAAARIAHRSGWLGRTDLTPLASYPHRQRFERNLAYVGAFIDSLIDPFAWTGGLTFYCTPDAFPFETNHLDATKPSLVTVNWTGIRSTQHMTWASVTNALAQRSVVVDSAVWSGISTLTVSGAVAPGGLTEGRTNTFRYWGKTNRFENCATGSPTVLAALNWFDVEYWRQYRPIENVLSSNSGDATGDFEVRAGPFIESTVLRVYDVTDSLNPSRLDGVDIAISGGAPYIRFQDNAAGGRRHYVAFDFPRGPAPGAMSAVTRHRVFDRTVGDYLLIVPQAYRTAVQPLVDLHTAQGLRVVVAPLEGVQDEFNGGRRSKHAIKRAIRYAYNNWNTRFVLLVGDGSLDPQRFIATSSPDVIPAPRMFGPVPVQVPPVDYLREVVVSDFWYVWALNSSDPSLAPLLPDLSIGRLPVSSLAHVNANVTKIVGYDNLTGDLAWRRRMLLQADDAYSGVSTFGGAPGTSDYCRRPGEVVFAEINAIVDSLIRKSAGLAQTQVDLFENSYYLPNRAGEYTTSGGADTCRNERNVFTTRARATITPELFSRLNAGRMWWNYQGHANQWVLSHEDFYLNNNGSTIDDKNQCQNDGKPFFFTGFSCHPNAFGEPNGSPTLANLGPPVGEELVNLGNNRGAVASWASSAYEALPIDETKHVNIYLAKAMFVNPPRDEYLGDRGARQIVGELILAALLENYVQRASYPFERDVAVTYGLLGDPATRLSIGTPQTIVTADGVPVTSGQDVRLRTAGPDVTFQADLVSTVRLDSLSFTRTSQSGTTLFWDQSQPLPAGFTLTPAYPDTARVGSLYGGRRFRLSFTDAPLAQNTRYVFRTVDRYGVVATFTAVFNFQVVLRVGGTAISEGDIVSPTADLSLLVISPAPLDPEADLTLVIGGNTVDFVATPANGDVSGREWILTWTHSPYAAGDYVLQLTPDGNPAVSRTFRVAETGLAVRLDNAYAFPNPFDEDYLRALNPGRDIATVFSFELVTAAPADVTLRIYTISGRLIYQRTERRLDARWHQLPWNGLDAEGYPIANGVYFYKLLASNGTGTAVKEGRLVKLRRPRRVESTSNEP